MKNVLTSVLVGILTASLPIWVASFSQLVVLAIVVGITYYGFLTGKAWWKACK